MPVAGCDARKDSADEKPRVAKPWAFNKRSMPLRTAALSSMIATVLGTADTGRGSPCLGCFIRLRAHSLRSPIIARESQARLLSLRPMSAVSADPDATESAPAPLPGGHSACAPHPQQHVIAPHQMMKQRGADMNGNQERD